MINAVPFMPSVGGCYACQPLPVPYGCFVVPYMSNVSSFSVYEALLLPNVDHADVLRLPSPTVTPKVLVARLSISLASPLRCDRECQLCMGQNPVRLVKPLTIDP